MSDFDNKSRLKEKARTQKKRARNLRLIYLFSVALLICAAFIGGFLFRGNAAFLQSLGFSSKVTGLEDTRADAASKDVYNSVSARLSEVEKILNEDSMDAYDLDAATNEVMSSLAQASADPYFRYFDTSRYSQLLADDAEGYAGVGVMFSEYNGQAYAVDVFEGSAAQLSDVQVGDFVVAINGDRSQAWTRSEVIAALNNLQGESVVITWRRPESLESEGGQEYTTALTCEPSIARNITTEYLNGVGYIDIRQFTQNTSELVQKAVEELEEQGAVSYVLDLRNNPGGYLNQAVNVASLFINSGNVVQIQTKNGVNPKAVSGTTATVRPVVVLVNQNTAASAEVLAAAFKETQRGTIVGQTTLGKGSVQVVRELSFGGAIRYTAAYYLTAQGRAIDKMGVNPDIAVYNGDSGDAQLDYAREYASVLASE